MAHPSRRGGLLLLEAVVWWGLTLGIWLLSLSAVSGQELIVATPTALGCGLLAVAARRAARGSWHLRARWLLPLLRLPVSIPLQTIGALASVVRADGGSFEAVALPEGVGDAPAARGRRAIATFLTTLSPGSVVVDADPDRGEALVHVLGARRGSAAGRAARR